MEERKPLEHGVHRVYVCEADSMHRVCEVEADCVNPKGVITLTDILKRVCAAAAEEEAGD